MPLISMHWFCILPHCWIAVWVLAVLGWSFGFSIHSIMSSAKRGSLTSLPIWMSFIYFCCLIAEAKTSSTMLNNRGENGHSCCVPDLRGKALSFSPLRMIFIYGSSIYGFYYIKVCSLYPYMGESFYQERMLYFVKCFFCIYWEDHIVLVLSFINVVYHIDGFVDVEPPLQPRNKSHLVVVNNPFKELLDPVG